MKKLSKYHVIIGLGALIGGVGGYFYWREIGCFSGSCAISSKPLNSIIYGTILGGYLFSFTKDLKILK